jgi:DNA invertase Pin-like site-specific DNA recombinase
VNDLKQREIGFKSLTENIDTTTAVGKYIFHTFAALAEFERNLIRERTQAGLQAARARGNRGGRPKALSPKKAERARKLYKDKKTKIADICKELGIARATFYRYVKPHQTEETH